MSPCFPSIRVAGLLLACALAAGCSDDDAAPGTAPSAIRHNRPARQADRFGLPAIATVFIPSAQKNAYNAAQPVNDPAEFTDEVVAVLTAFGHPDPAGLASVLLPDIQPVNTSQPSGFLNGRRPQDDVITAELGIIFGGNAALNDDHVDQNDKAFLPVFPYFAPPHLP
jgi:Domain of unknown function (DUF4331)